MEPLKALEADAQAIEDSLNQAPLDAPDVHPNVAELYRRKVERLTEALNDPEDRAEAATALRGLIDKDRADPRLQARRDQRAALR
jgi:site-specific DNA recombinase